MTEFEKNFEIFRLWTLLGVIAGFVGLGLLIYGFSKRRNTLKALGLTLFGHMFLCGLIFSLLTNYFLRRASSELLQILNDPKVTLSLCDRTVSEDIQAAFISEIKLLGNISRHKSQPLDTLPIRILKDRIDIKIRIQRDSDRKNEFWIYWDRYRITRESPIGYLKTSKFDNIVCR
jgi:hypothetical protein